MVAARRCLSLLFLSTCVALLLQPALGDSGAPVKPAHPGDNATPRQLAQYTAQLRSYLDLVTMPRYGKRDQEETPLNFLEWGAPDKVAPRELTQMDV